MTTAPPPHRDLVETLEYRGSTIYLYHQPEQHLPYEKDVYEPYGGRKMVKVGTEPAVQDYSDQWYASFKELPNYRWSHFRGDTKAKALKSIQHNVDVALADEALRPTLIKLVGYDKDGSLTDRLPFASPSGVRDGDVAWLYSRGGWRRGVIEKVGRTNVTVAYVTEGGVREAQERNFDPVVTRKSAKFEQVLIES